MSTGAVLQLASYGAQDLYLTGNPQVTMFKSVVKRHTNFAIETIENYFDGKISFGSRVSCKLQRIGDLVSQVFLRVVLPPLQPTQGQDNIFTSWVNVIGFAMIEYIDLFIGEQRIDRQYGQWMFIWAELTQDTATRGALAGMIGGNSVFTPATQNGPLQLYIPLYFWFCRDIGSSIPLIALQHQEIKLTVQFRQFSELWVSNDLVAARQVVSPETDFLECYLMVDYVFLDTDERRFFAQNRHFYLIEQVQLQNISIDISKEENLIDLPFNHPVKELVWIIQGQKIREAKEWFNFSDDFNNSTAPIQYALLRFNGLERFKERHESYFREVIPWQRHTSSPGRFIYDWSFATDPEKLQPTGTCNFSCLDSATLHLRTNNIGQSQVSVYATNYNILRFIGGLSGIMFTD